MLHFTVDDVQAVSGCQTCCCEKLQLKPGTTEKLSVGYAPWAVPIGQLHCLPRFQIEPMETCPAPVGGDLPPTVTSLDGAVRFNTDLNTHLDGDLRAQIADPEGLDLVFKLLPLYGPNHGKLVLNATGMFDYDPSLNFKGEERFFVTASDGKNAPVIFEVLIAIGIDINLPTPTPPISIDSNAIVVDQRYFMVSFPIKVSPAAPLCEVWRLTVLQSALDCDCHCFARTDCFDIKVIRC